MGQTNQYRLLQDQVDTLYSTAVSSNLAIILTVGLFLTVLSGSTVDQSWLFTWSSIMVLLSVIRLHVWRLRNNYPDNRTIQSWSNLYTRLTIVMGLFWASSCFILFQTETLLEVSFLYVIIFCVISASVSLLSSMPSVFYAFILPPTITLGLIPWFEDRVPYFLSIAIVVLAALSTVTGKNLHRRLIQALSLQYENENLEHEILERKRAEEDLKHLAHHDTLTNLPNRLLLDARLKHAIQNSDRSNNKKVAILFIDLDHFKNINDSLGHIIGDGLLQTIGARLQAAAREADTIARLGGDEFIVIIEHITNKEDIITIAEKIMNAIKEPMTVRGHKLHTSSSIGISVYPHDGNTAEELLKNADAAMYKAKGLGRHNYQFYTKDLTASALERVTLENDLITALDNDQIETFYQLQISLTNRSIIGAEALVRWRHPELGLLSPTKFLAIAEQTGLIKPLGEKVLQQACMQMKAWKDKGIDIEKIAVNISSSQIKSLEIATVVESICNTTKCRPEWLELEITEDFIMQDSVKAIATLEHLRNKGINFSIDDFGTGYSSLSHLKQLPINKLKIDKSFIRDIATDPDDATIVRAIIAMAKSLNLDVIAEGVEYKHQEDFLIKEGCHSAQGFYYSKPIPASDFENVYYSFKEKELSQA